MAITNYVDFVNDYLVKNGMIGNATNMNKAPDQLKKEIDEINAAKVDFVTYNASNLSRADKYLASQNIAAMIYNVGGDLTKIRYKADSDVDYETFSYTGANLTGIAHYVGGVLKGNSVLSYDGDGDLLSVIFTAV